MSTWSDFGNLIKDSALSGIAQGINESRLSILTPSADFGESYNAGDELMDDVMSFYYNDKKNDDLTNTVSEVADSVGSNSRITEQNKRWKHTSLNRNAKSNWNFSDYYDNQNYRLQLPLWGYDDFINERNLFLKGLGNNYAGPSWMYFKIFFNFNTMYGLFGSILNMKSPVSSFVGDDTLANNSWPAINSALKYLYLCEKRYQTSGLTNKGIALIKFVRLLSYINTRAPWFFKSIKNLNNAGNPYIAKFGEEKSIEIDFLEDAIDMRLTTLFSLYKYACFDDINCKEIIPENLRKFDMDIVIMQSPIKILHTPNKNREDGNILGGTQYKDLSNESQNDNKMSFKLYRLLNCEFDISSLGSYAPGEMTNDNPFQFGKNSIKITYDRCYEYTMNEIMGFMFGSNGIYVDNEVVFNTSVKNIVTASEEFINTHVDKLLGSDKNFALGNIYGADRRTRKYNSSILTDYMKEKLRQLKPDKSLINYFRDFGFNILQKWLGTSYRAGAALGTREDGTVLKGENGDLGTGSAMFYKKMEDLKNGPSTSIRGKRITAQYNINNMRLRYNFSKNVINNVNPSSLIQ